MTELEASRWTRESGFTLTRTHVGEYQVRRGTAADAEVVGRGELITALVKAGVPVEIRTEDEAQAVAEAALGPLGTVYDGDAEKIVGEAALLGNVRAGGQIPALPPHGIGRIHGRGSCWREAFRAAGVAVRG